MTGRTGYSKRMGKLLIEAWNQPDGIGHGWAPCSRNRAEKFFVFNRETGQRIIEREFTSLMAAISFCEEQNAQRYTEPSKYGL